MGSNQAGCTLYKYENVNLKKIYIILELCEEFFGAFEIVENKNLLVVGMLSGHFLMTETYDLDFLTEREIFLLKLRNILQADH